MRHVFFELSQAAAGAGNDPRFGLGVGVARGLFRKREALLCAGGVADLFVELGKELPTGGDFAAQSRRLCFEDGPRQLALDLPRTEAPRAGLDAQTQKPDVQGDAQVRRKAVESLAPAIGEGLRLEVGKDTYAPLAGGDASAHAELVVSTQRGVVRHVAGQKPRRVGQLGEHARDFEVDELAARFRRLPVRRLANEIVREVVVKGATGRRNAAQNAATARSRSLRLCAADIWVRMRAVPRGTTG